MKKFATFSVYNSPSSQLTSLIWAEDTGGPTRPVVLSHATINQSINQSINQPINQPISQSTNQPTNHSANTEMSTKRYVCKSTKKDAKFLSFRRVFFFNHPTVASNKIFLDLNNRHKLLSSSIYSRPFRLLTIANSSCSTHLSETIPLTNRTTEAHIHKELGVLGQRGSTTNDLAHTTP